MPVPSPRHPRCTAGAPRISVVTPSYNQGAFIERCIRSVAEQGYPDFEHIVFDNCSTDTTHAVLRRFPHVKWISEPDSGQSDALNKAICRSRGEIIAWINADDFYEPGTFHVVARELRIETATRAVAGRVHLVSSEGELLETTSPRFDGVDGLVRFWDGGYGLCQPGIFFRRELIEELGEFRTDLHFAMDYEFWLRVARKYPFKILDRALARYVVHPASKTGSARHGRGFNEELTQVSRLHWGPVHSRRYWRFRRGCDRFLADCALNALVHAHRHERRIRLALLCELLRRKPSYLLHRHLLAVLAERALGAGRWDAMKRTLRRLPAPRTTLTRRTRS